MVEVLAHRLQNQVGLLLLERLLLQQRQVLLVKLVSRRTKNGLFQKSSVQACQCLQLLLVQKHLVPLGDLVRVVSVIELFHVFVGSLKSAQIQLTLFLGLLQVLLLLSRT